MARHVGARINHGNVAVADDVNAGALIGETGPGLAATTRRISGPHLLRLA